MPLTGLALVLLSVATLTGWLAGPLGRLHLRPGSAALICMALLAAPGRLWHLSLTPLAPWLPPGVRPVLPLDPGAFLLPLLLAAMAAGSEGRHTIRRTLLAATVVGTGLLTCFLILPGEPAQTALMDPTTLYAVAAGLAACLLAGSAAGAAATAAFGYAVAETGRAVNSLWHGAPVLSLGGDRSLPLLLASLVAIAGAELVYGARLTGVTALDPGHHRLPPRN